MDLYFEGAHQIQNKIYGVVVGIVVDNKDPEGFYRVKVKFPWIKESNSKYTDKPDKQDFFSTWCRIATFMAGHQRGSFWLPEVDDEVLVAFEHGDIRRPYVIGALWNGVDLTYHDNKSQDGKNNYRTFRSRSGHQITFLDDAENKKEKIIIQTKVPADKAQADSAQGRGGHFIVLDHTDGKEKIEIYDKTEKNYILIDTVKNTITIQTDKDINIFCKNDLNIKADNNINIEAGKNITVKSGSATKVNAGSTMNLEASSNNTIKGAKVLIN